MFRDRTFGSSVVVLALVLAATACSGTGGVETPCQPAFCPVADQPYLDLDCPACLELIPPPQIISTTINPPGGGKLPINATFRAEVEAPFPELEPGITLWWDIDGESGIDVTVDSDEQFQFQYESDCSDEDKAGRTVAVRVLPQDRFGRFGNEVERSIRLNCNRPPIVTQFIVTTVGGDVAEGRPGTDMRFFYAAEDPDYEGDADFDGITKIEIDYEGDGIFDSDLNISAQGLPHFRSYDFAGVFRPVLRVVDADGDSAVSDQLKVTIFAVLDFVTRRKTSGGVLTVNSVPELADAIPGQKVAIGMENIAWGWLERQPADDTLHVSGLKSFPAGDNRSTYDIQPVGELLFTADRAADVNLINLGSAGSARNDPTRSKCTAGQNGARRLLDVRYQSGSTQLLLVNAPINNSGTMAQVGVLDATLLLDGLQGADCDSEVAAYGTVDGILTESGTPFGTNPVLRDLAAVDRFLFAAAEATDGSGGVMAWDLAVTTLTPLCDPGDGEGCLLKPDPVVAVSSFDGLTATTMIDAARYVSVATDIVVVPSRLFLAPGTRATDQLWLDSGPPVSQGGATWWNAATNQIGFDRSFFFAQVATASAVTAQVTGQRVLATLSDIGDLSFYGVSITESPLTYASLGPSMSLAAERIYMLGEHLVWLTRGLAYDSTGTTFFDRQPNGVYIAPATEPSRWIRVDAVDRSCRDTAGYLGPRDVAQDETLAGLWVADGTCGVFHVDLSSFHESAYASAPTWTTSYTSPGLEVRLTGSPRAMEVDPVNDRMYLDLGLGGIGAFAVPSAAAPDFRWIRPVSGTAAGVGLVPGPPGSPYVIAGDEGGFAVVPPATPGRSAAGGWYRSPAGNNGFYLTARKDPQSDRHGVVMLGENRDDGNQSYLLAGLDDAGRLVPGWRHRLPEDMGAPVFFGTRPPVFGRLTKGALPRLIWNEFSSRPRICIERLWGENCGGDETFNANFTGNAFSATSNGDPLIMVYNSNTKQISIFDADGLPLYDFFSLCGELQAAELQACSINSAVVGGYSVDPYWIASTQYGAFVVDLSIPTRPTVVTRIAYPGCDDVSFVTGWKEGQELVLVYRDTCETSLGKELFFFKSEQIGSGS